MPELFLFMIIPNLRKPKRELQAGSIQLEEAASA